MPATTLWFMKPVEVGPVRRRMLLFLGIPSQMSLVDDISAARIASALEQVGPRLRRLRAQREMTLTGVSASTGISKSTLSRLETGQRRPTLELLLALSHAYRVPLDDLVAAPEEGDPRLWLRPGRVKGRTVIPLTRQPDGMQAWKIVIPISNATPEPRAHDGEDWIYVLSGHMRFVLEDRDLVLGPGDVAAFDTKVPHWFGSTGDAPAEILSIFGRPGERMTIRTDQVRTEQ
jgi:transcriptional regulator with XRE-family HTH domain